MPYRITNFERFMHPDAKRGSTMPWVKTPTNHDGLGYLALMDHPNGEAHFGIWNIILQLAANGSPRGVLATDGGRILGAKEISLKTRAKVPLVEEAISRLLEIGWLEVEGALQATCKQHASLEERRGEDKKKRGEEREPDGSEADSVGPLFSTRDGAWRMSAGFRQSMAELFPTAPLDVEFAKAAAWTESATKKKTARGMHAFLTNWLARNYAKPPTPPAERPTDDALAELAAETARLRAAGQIK